MKFALTQDKANQLLNNRPLIDTDKNLIIVAKITEKLNRQASLTQTKMGGVMTNVRKICDVGL